MSEWPAYWWNSITGPGNLLNALVTALQAKNVCLVVPDDLAWRAEMRTAVQHKLHELEGMKKFNLENPIDVADDCPDCDDDDNIGRYLLQRFARPDIAAGYRRREKIQQYIAENEVLQARLIWVKGMNAAQEKSWLKFCRDYTAGGEKAGRFVLECHGTARLTPGRNISIIHYDEFVRPQDVLLFDSIYLSRSSTQLPPLWQQYAALLCATLSGGDAQISVALMDAMDVRSEEPTLALKALSDDARFLRRGDESGTHILSRVRAGDYGAIEKLIWQAQLQILFPLLELERMDFLARFHHEVEEALQASYYDEESGSPRKVKQFDEYVADASDAELGTLYRLTKLRRYDDTSQYLLYLANESARNRLELLHEMRNSLAHGKACSVSMVADFIDAHPFRWK